MAITPHPPREGSFDTFKVVVVGLGGLLSVAELRVLVLRPLCLAPLRLSPPVSSGLPCASLPVKVAPLGPHGVCCP